jgi:aryl-alcohol dehydrogenase-like predicted oxidoreductase
VSEKPISRRDFLADAARTAGGVTAAVTAASAATQRKPVPAKAKQPAQNTSKILNYNPNMEYRRLGKTGMMVSAVCLGGHWKRVNTMLGGKLKGSEGYSKNDEDNINDADFLKSRDAVVSRCMEVGINYIDACAGPEIMAYSRVLRGRRQKMHLGYSWHVRESRYNAWRSGPKLIEGLEQGMREAKLDYVDVWRISLPQERMPDLSEVLAIEEGAVEALAKAKKQGKVRFTGISTHNRIWLKSVIEQYPEQMEVVLFPYTAASKELPDDSVFDAIRQHNVGVFGIKPFADNSLFAGDSSLNSPHREEDDRRARLALRYILSNPAITAPIPGMINPHQVDNAALAVQERRKLDLKEKAELEKACEKMWANLRPNHQWLRDWEYV